MPSSIAPVLGGYVDGSKSISIILTSSDATFDNVTPDMVHMEAVGMTFVVKHVKVKRRNKSALLVVATVTVVGDDDDGGTVGDGTEMTVTVDGYSGSTKGPVVTDS